MNQLCEYCGDREGEVLDRWDGWTCRACLTEAEALWRTSAAGQLDALSREMAALAGPGLWWLVRRVAKAEAFLEALYWKTIKRAPKALRKAKR